MTCEKLVLNQLLIPLTCRVSTRTKHLPHPTLSFKDKKNIYIENLILILLSAFFVSFVHQRKMRNGIQKLIWGWFCPCLDYTFLHQQQCESETPPISNLNIDWYFSECILFKMGKWSHRCNVVIIPPVILFRKKIVQVVTLNSLCSIKVHITNKDRWKNHTFV